jgi:hypothetical protein
MTRIILEFIDGLWDGMNLCNDSPDLVEVRLALHVYSVTGNANIGQTVIMPSDYAIGKGEGGDSTYVVTNCTEMDDEVLVRLECDCTKIAAPHTQPGEHLVLHFEGGYLHGHCLHSQSPDINEALLALAYYHITNHGTVGETFNGIPATWCPPKNDSAAPEQASCRKGYEYCVVERLVRAEEVHISFEYRRKGKSEDNPLNME